MLHSLAENKGAFDQSCSQLVGRNFKILMLLLPWNAANRLPSWKDDAMTYEQNWEETPDGIETYLVYYEENTLLLNADVAARAMHQWLTFTSLQGLGFPLKCQRKTKYTEKWTELVRPDISGLKEFIETKVLHSQTRCDISCLPLKQSTAESH